MNHQEAAKFIVDKCLKRNVAIISRQGEQQRWMLDIRRALLNKEFLQFAAQCFWQHYEFDGLFQIGTVETAAIPLLAALIIHAPEKRGSVNGFVVRKERKSTGLGRQIEGEVIDLPIVLVDDILNTGDSINKVLVILDSLGYKVSNLYVIADYKSGIGANWRMKNGIAVHSVFSLTDLGVSPEKREYHKTRSYSTIWHVKGEEGNPFYVVPKSAPILFDQHIFRGSDRGLMQAFDAVSGKVRWSCYIPAAFPGKGIWSTPAIHDGKVYFGAYNGSVYCLDSYTGAEIWSQSHCDWIGSSPLLLPNLGLICIGLEYERTRAQGGLAALAMNNGEKVWEISIEKYQHGSAAYWPEGNLVIWGTADHTTLGIHAETGVVAWSLPTGRSVKSAPTVDAQQQVTAFASFDGCIYIADVRNGSLLVKWETGDICYTSPLLLRGKVFCGSADRCLYVGELSTGKLIAKLDTGSRVFASPQAIGTRVIFGTTGGKLIEIDSETLDIISVTQLPDAITNAVAISEDGNRVYVSTAMNDLFALERG